MNWKRNTEVNEIGWYFVLDPLNKKYEATVVDRTSVNGGSLQYYCYLSYEYDDGSGQVIKEPFNLKELDKHLFYGPVIFPKPNQALIDKICMYKDIIE